MKSLFFNYNVRSPFAALAEDGRVLRQIKETDYYDSVNPRGTFPENAIEQLLGSCDHVGHVVFLGKPFVFLENLVNLHAHLFPHACGRFAGDLFHFFSKVMNPRDVVREVIKDNELLVTADLDRLYYVRQDEALAHAADAASGSTIVTCLSDVFEGTSCCCFEKRDGRTVLTGETEAVSSFANLLRLNETHNGGVELKNLVSPDSHGGWRFSKNRLQISNVAFDLAPSHSPQQGDFSGQNAHILACLFSKLVASIARAGQPLIFISDVEIPSQIREEHPDVAFFTVNDEEKGSAAALFFHDRLSDAIKH